MLVNIISMFKQKKGVEVFKRRISDEIVKMASCVLMAYLVLTLIVSLIICQLENISYITVLFECVSAIATVGLTIGITSQLGVISQCLLALLMLFGRVGSITFLLAFASNR